MDKAKLKETHEQEYSPSIFIMFTKSLKVVWRSSGNELRDIYLDTPHEFLCGPVEVPIPEHLDKVLKEYQAQQDGELLEKILEEIHADAMDTDVEIPRITPEEEIEAQKRWAAWKKRYPEEYQDGTH